MSFRTMNDEVMEQALGESQNNFAQTWGQKLVNCLRAVHNRAEMVRRLKSRALKDNRLDDANEATIRHRLEVYDSESRPVLAYYPKNIRVDVDALQTPIEVAHDILSAVLGRTQELHEVPPVPVAVGAAKGRARSKAR